MLQLTNSSPFAAGISVFPDENAIDTLYVVLKATYTLRPQLVIADTPVAPVMADEYWGEPATSSLKYMSEMHIGKPATDVVLIGQAWAPGHKVTTTLVSVNVAGREKAVQIFGDRIWRREGFTPPEPFESMPLLYERAFGGQQPVAADGRGAAEERNPVGVGFLGNRPPDELLGKPLPNLEDPRQLVRARGDLRPPASFGFVAAAWFPRRTFAGTYDQAWQSKRSPYLPLDFNRRFFNAAPPELTFDRFLVGGEPVEIQGASREGPLRFSLPRLQPRVAVKIAGAEEKPTFKLETVLIEPDDNRVCLTWRAQLPCDKKVLKVQRVAIEVPGVER